MSNAAPLLVPVALPVDQSAAPQWEQSPAPRCGVLPRRLVQAAGGARVNAESGVQECYLPCLGWRSWHRGRGPPLQLHGVGGESFAGRGEVEEEGWEQVFRPMSKWGDAVPL